MTTGEIIALTSAVVAVLALLFNVSRSRTSDITAAQATRDKLDYISDNTRDIREDVRALDRKLDDHASKITKMQAQLDDHDRRLEKLEV